jgi:hypothetical protein
MPVSGFLFQKIKVNHLLFALALSRWTCSIFDRNKRADFTLNLSIFCLRAQLSNFAPVLYGTIIPMLARYRFLPIINNARILSRGR